MLEAMVSGIEDPRLLRRWPRAGCATSKLIWQRRLQGLVGPHQRMLLDSLLRHLDFLDKEINRLDSEVAQRMRPFDEEIERLDGIPRDGSQVN